MAEQIQTVGRVREMPLLSEIAAAWRDSKGVEQVFPRFQEFKPSWWHPFCFRCGWIVPTKKGDEYPEGWKDERVFLLTWGAASGWLERAHLHDHVHDGGEALDNLVPLCVLCHEEQPICRSRDEGLSFVRSRSPRWRIQFWLQVATERRYGHRDLRKPGKEKALRSMLRAQGDVAISLAEAAEKTLEELG